MNAPSASPIKGEIDISLTFIACAKPLLTRLDDALVGGGDAPRELLSGLADEALALLLDAERYATSASEMLGVVADGGAA